jgi:septal ring factor EnvC (AmiA/AmiB activator)
VRAVAAGRVVFADWLRGFGNLIIVDHGNQYMTIYGNNQSVLKRAGDLVKTGKPLPLQATAAAMSNRVYTLKCGIKAAHSTHRGG